MNKYTVIYLVSVLTAFIGTAMLVCLPVGFLMNDPDTVLLEFSFCSILTIAAVICNIVLGTLIAINHGATLELLQLIFNMFWGLYGAAFIVGAITTLTEWKKINLDPFRKIFYMFTFPLFMLTYIPISSLRVP